MIIAIPLIDVPYKKTEVARGILPKNVSLKSVVHNVSNARYYCCRFSLERC